MSTLSTLYAPAHARENDVARLQAFIESCGLATVATVAHSCVVASHVPLLCDRGTGPFGTLVGHLARANLQWRDTVRTIQALAIFRGPDAYVSPTYYETTRTTGKVVPTWNYEVVHASGPIEFFDDRDRLLQVVTRLTDAREANIVKPWHVSDAPADYIEAELKGIVGFTIAIERLEGAFKLSGNRNDADRAGVIAALDTSDRRSDRDVAQLMREER